MLVFNNFFTQNFLWIDILIVKKKDINICKNNFLKQEPFLKDIQDMLEKFPNDTSIIEKLNQLRNSILNEKNLRFYMCTDLLKLGQLFPNGLDLIWLEHFHGNNFLY